MSSVLSVRVRLCVQMRVRCVRARDRVGKYGLLGAWRLPGGPSLAWVSKGPRGDPGGDFLPYRVRR